MPFIFGFNPVFEALEAGQAIDKIYLQSGRRNSLIGRIYRLAKEQKIQVVNADQKKMRLLAGNNKHHGIAALLSNIRYIALEDLVEKIQKKGERPNLVMLDKIQDPHNFGAIIRSAEVLGAHGVLFSLRESVPVTEVVIKASAGAVFNIDICKIDNMARAIDYLRNCGLWIYSSSAHTGKELWKMDFLQPQAIIIGSEGKGVRPLLLKKSDEIFRISQEGKTESLNASVSAGIILAEVLRQRRMRVPL
jgi:23S rRNA (guanosine2251-2'-O)-methyltransferase